MNRYTLILAALLASLAVPASAAPKGLSQTPDRYTTITVTGQGVASRAPDFANINASIVTSDDDSSKATADNNARFDAVHAALAKLGAADSDILTTYYNVNFMPRPEPTGSANVPMRPIGYYQRYGYIVSRNVQIKFRSLTNIGAAVDAIIRAGASTVSNVSYGLNDQRTAYAEAVKSAMKDARSQADAIAAAAGVRIVRLRSVQSSSYYPGPVPMYRSTVVMGVPAPMPAPGPPTTLPPGNIDMHASLTAIYEVSP